jgi:hypothetical protein
LLLMMLLLLLRHALACPLPKQGGHRHRLPHPSKGPTQSGGDPSLIWARFANLKIKIRNFWCNSLGH